MHNKVVEAFMDDCASEFERIAGIITVPEDSGSTKETNAVRVDSLPFLTKYALIKSCGIIELCFKTIICDQVSQKENVRIKKYLDDTFLSRGVNPKVKAIAGYLAKFDEAWPKEFENRVQVKDDKISPSMRYLVDERNKHAHGKDTRIGFHEILSCFRYGRMAVEILDDVVSGS